MLSKMPRKKRALHGNDNYVSTAFARSVSFSVTSFDSACISFSWFRFSRKEGLVQVVLSFYLKCFSKKTIRQ